MSKILISPVHISFLGLMMDIIDSKGPSSIFRQNKKQNHPPFPPKEGGMVISIYANLTTPLPGSGIFFRFLSY